LVARDFAIRGGGAIGLGGDVDLGATLLPSVALTRRLIEQASVMKHLVDSSGRIVVPFRLSGTLPSAKPSPDLGALTAALQRNLIEDLGDRVFGGGKKPKLDEKPPPAEPPAPEVKPPAKEIPEAGGETPSTEKPRETPRKPRSEAKPPEGTKPARPKKPAAPKTESRSDATEQGETEIAPAR
jgi:hypothetical protein